jgi:hypothetical protein
MCVVVFHLRLDHVVTHCTGAMACSLSPIHMEIDRPNDPNHILSPRDLVDVYVFNAKDQATSLLQDMGIMSDLNNLAVNQQDPFGQYMSPDGRLGEDKNSGKWHDRAYQNLINKDAPLLEFLISIIMYCDKTGTSVQQRHGLEPLMMTFTFFIPGTHSQSNVPCLVSVGVHSQFRTRFGGRKANIGGLCSSWSEISQLSRMSGSCSCIVRTTDKWRNYNVPYTWGARLQSASQADSVLQCSWAMVRVDKFRTGMKYLVPCAIQGATRDVV